MHSRIPFELKQILITRVNKINKLLNASCGCSHTEFRVEETDKEHADIQYHDKYYRARLIETAIRAGGAFMQPAIAMATGFNSIRAMAYQACELLHTEKVLYRYPMIMANLWADKPGIIESIGGLDKILSLKEKLAAFHLYDGIGDTIMLPPEASRGIADAIIYGKNIDLNNFPNWEIMSGQDSLYREVEQLYLDIVNAFKPVVR